MRVARPLFKYGTQFSDQYSESGNGVYRSQYASVHLVRRVNSKYMYTPTVLYT